MPLLCFEFQCTSSPKNKLRCPKAINFIYFEIRFDKYEAKSISRSHKFKHHMLIYLIIGYTWSERDICIHEALTS